METQWLTIGLFVLQAMWAVILMLLGYVLTRIASDIRANSQALDKLTGAVSELRLETLKNYTLKGDFDSNINHFRERIDTAFNALAGVEAQVHILAAHAGVSLPAR